MNNEEHFDFHYQSFSPPSGFNLDSYLEKARYKQKKQIHIQLIDPKLIVSEKHIKVAIYHTIKIFKQKRNIARDKSTELLLRISGKKQISSALELFGVKDSSKIILVVAFGGNSEENIEAIDQYLQSINIVNEMKADIKFPLLDLKALSQEYQCDAEITSIEKAVLEKIAMLNIMQI